MPDVKSTVTSGVYARFFQRGGATTDPGDQYVIPVRDRVTSFVGTTSTFQVPGRATVTQRLLTIQNTAASGSTLLCAVQRSTVDVLITAAAVATGVNPGAIRINRFTGAVTGGTAMTKMPMDVAGTTSAAIVVTADASGDGTSSATALAVGTLGAMGTSIYAPRLLQATATAGNAPVYEPVDTASFFSGEPELVLRPGEGMVLSVDGATVTTGNPTTNRWLVSLLWEEFTRP